MECVLRSLSDFSLDEQNRRVLPWSSKNPPSNHGHTPCRPPDPGHDYPGYGYFPHAYATPEKVVSTRRTGGNIEYLIKWCSTPYSDCTWELADALAHYLPPDLLQRFERCNKFLFTDSDLPLAKAKQEIVSQNTVAVNVLLDPRTRTGAIRHFSECCKLNDDSPGRKGPRSYSYSPGAQNLYDFQVEGVSWLLRSWASAPTGGCILADEMGLGKTVQTSVFIDQAVHNMRKSLTMLEGTKAYVKPLPVLIVCPVSTLEQWRREVLTWTRLCALEPLVFHGGKRDRAVIEKYETRGAVQLREGAGPWNAEVGK